MGNEEIVDNLTKLAKEHQKHMDNIREKVRAIVDIPKAQALVGRYFKYPNSYVFGGMRRGIVYKHIVGTVRDSLLVDGFQTDGPNKVEFEFSRHEYTGHFTHSSVVEISEKEYFKAFDKMIKIIAKVAKQKYKGK